MVDFLVKKFISRPDDWEDPELLQRTGAVQALTVAAAVLTAAVQDGHDHAQTVRFAAGRLNDALEVLEVVVGRHVILAAVHVIRQAVISHIHNKVQVIAADGGFDQAFSVAGRKAGAFVLNEEGVLIEARLLGPADKVFVDLRGQFLRTRQGDETQIRYTLFKTKKFLRTFCLH